MSFYCYIPKTLFLIFSVCFHVEIVVSVWGVPNVTIPNAEYSAWYGGYITLECIVDSTPNHTDVYWQHISNGTIKNITSSSPNVANGATVSEPSLSIRHITFNDDGQYICFAINIIGTGDSTPTNLTVLGGVPIVHVEPGPYSVEYGQDITLVCDITSYPPHFNVYWSRVLNGRTRTSHAEGNITYSPDMIALLDVTFEESGQYRCHAENMIGIGQSNPVNLTVYGGVPNVTIPHLKYSRGYGWHMTLECIIVSTPNHTGVYWQKVSNGTVMNITSPSPTVYGATVIEPSLTIRRLTTDDEGQYICLAVNMVGTGRSKPTTLTVLGGDLVVNSSITSYTEVYGSQVTLRCSVLYETKFRPVLVTWNGYNRSGKVIHVYSAFYGNEHINVSSHSVVIPEKNGFVMDHHYLTISQLAFEDEAWYQCHAHNNFSSEGSPQIELTIIGGVPIVTIPIVDYSKGYGWYITLECIVDSTPNHTDVYWQHISNGTIKNITSSSPNVAYGATVSEPSLSIRHITFNDEGQYICFAVNIVGTGESTPTNLTVLGGEIVVNYSKTEYTEVYGSQVTIQCSVTYEIKFEPLHLYWKKWNDSGFTVTVDPAFDGNGHVTLYNYSVAIPERDGFKMNHNFLILSPLLFEDTGWYRCSARDQVSLGSGQAITLTVIGSLLLKTSSKMLWTINKRKILQM